MNKKGFTLIELLVVIAIIGILASIVLVSLNTARSKARDTRRAGDLAQVQLALEMYFDSYGAYPPQSGATGTISATAAACPVLPATCAAADNLQCLVGCGYMPAIPKDPGSTSYLYFTGLNRYILQAIMENNNYSGLANDLDVCTNTGSGAPCACTDTACTGGTNCYYCVGI